MNFKLKTLIAVLALSVAATSVNAADTSSGANGSSVIFSAWDASAGGGVGASYTFDIGLYLNTLVGADTATSSPATFTTASNSAYAGAGTGDGYTIANIALTGFNLTQGVWNLAAGDGVGRRRVLATNINTPFTTTTNSQITTTTNAITNFIGFGAANSTSTGTLSDGTKTDYAGGTSWGDTLGAGTGFSGSSNTLNFGALGTGSNSDLYVAWQKSSTTSAAAGLANLTYNGNNVFATTYSLAGTTYLNISSVAAVPETDTSGMMLAGLGLMGFIARRRNGKQA